MDCRKHLLPVDLYRLSTRQHQLSWLRLLDSNLASDYTSDMGGSISFLGLEIGANGDFSEMQRRNILEKENFTLDESESSAVLYNVVLPAQQAAFQACVESELKDKFGLNARLLQQEVTQATIAVSWKSTGGQFANVSFSGTPDLTLPDGLTLNSGEVKYVVVQHENKPGAKLTIQAGEQNGPVITTDVRIVPVTESRAFDGSLQYAPTLNCLITDCKSSFPVSFNVNSAVTGTATITLEMARDVSGVAAVQGVDRRVCFSFSLDGVDVGPSDSSEQLADADVNGLFFTESRDLGTITLIPGSQLLVDLKARANDNVASQGNDAFPVYVRRATIKLVA